MYLTITLKNSKWWDIRAGEKNTVGRRGEIWRRPHRTKDLGAKASSGQTEGASRCQQPQHQSDAGAASWEGSDCLLLCHPSALPPSTGPRSTKCQLRDPGRGSRSESRALVSVRQTHSLPVKEALQKEKTHARDLPSKHRPYSPMSPKC